MKKDTNSRKTVQLGAPIGTTSNRLKKSIMHSLLKRLSLNFCYRCAAEILTPEELSIDHKIDWLDSKNPTELFYNIDNIAFSHHSCNCAAAKKTNQKCTIRSSASKLKGVRKPDSRKIHFSMVFRLDGKTLIFGGYKTALEAALAYDKKAIEIYGDKAVTNKNLGLL